jgi:hypothetical protein
MLLLWASLCLIEFWEPQFSGLLIPHTLTASWVVAISEIQWAVVAGTLRSGFDLYSKN